eukprot:TRINITY_DN2443_c0_g1_i2.p1 TRINITY_DN2443_c0_g1~~TRINITY_DN2443_c0_g1_i2.p1  ORF type:complete len:1166 (+),score=280.64 TRINITY_DN2443_c0_g1_i2:2107-5604(+)
MEVKHYIGKVLATLLHVLPEATTPGAVCDKLFTMLNAAKHNSSGPLCALSYIVGQHTKQQQAGHVAAGSLDLLLKTTSQCIVLITSLGDPVNATLACHCIEIIARQVDTTPMLDGEQGASLISALLSASKSSASRTLSEAAVCALGMLFSRATSVAAASVLAVVDALFVLGEHTSEELHFSAGEALAQIACGRYGKVPRDPLFPDAHETADTVAYPTDGSYNVETMRLILRRIFGMINSPKTPQHRSSAAIWLLSLTSFSSTNPVIKDNLNTLQSVFMSLLCENSEVIQEVAANGISIAHDLGSTEQKKALVDGLVSTLVLGEPSRVKVLTPDHVLFPDPIDLPQTNPSSSSPPETMSTYKELCSMATDVGQPDLVYKFMNLASHSALWNSKKGAALAAKTIAAHAKSELEPFLPVIVPKLYRLSYDPNPRVAVAMGNILKAVVDIRKASEIYFGTIVKEILQNIMSPQWRARESAAMALADAVQGRTWQQVEEFLEPLLYSSFRVLDDIKETVRKAAAMAVTSMAALVVRLVDPKLTPGAQGQRVLSILVPLLLTKGILSQAENVVKFSISLLNKIFKVGQNLLVPHVGEVTCVMLQALSALEPQVLNYMSFHMEGEALDQARVLVSNLSPVNEILDACVKHTENSNVAQVIGKTVQAMTEGVGLATRAGICKFIYTLVTQCTTHAEVDLRPHVSPLVKPLLKFLEDRSIPVRESAAQALGSLVRLCSPQLTRHVLDHLSATYWERGAAEESIKISCATAVKEICHLSADHLVEYYELVVPLVTVGRSDTVAAARTCFEDAWSFIGLGSVRTFTGAVVALACQAMSQQAYKSRVQGAQAIAQLATTLCASDMLQHLNECTTSLLAGLKEVRIWPGKEKFLEALAALVTTCKDGFESAGAPVAKVDLLALAVAQSKRRKNVLYRHKALLLLLSLLQTFDYPNAYDGIAEFTVHWRDELQAAEKERDERNKELREQRDGQRSTQGDDDTAASAVVDERAVYGSVAKVAVTCLARAWSVTDASRREHFGLHVTALCETLAACSRDTQLEAVQALQQAVDGWDCGDGDTAVAAATVDAVLSATQRAGPHRSRHADLRGAACSLLALLLGIVARHPALVGSLFGVQETTRTEALRLVVSDVRQDDASAAFLAAASSLLAVRSHEVSVTK